MPHFTLQVAPNGPLMDAFIGVSEAKKAALLKANQEVPKPRQIRALVDTGASCLCVDPSVLKELALVPTGKTTVVSPTTGTQPKEVDQYDVSLVIPCGHHAPFTMETIAAVESELLLPQGFHALIGRDILKHCLPTYNGTVDLFTLAY
jgi:hypothetical protein